MKKSAEENIQEQKSQKSAVTETSQKFKEIMRYLLGYTNLKPTKKVENFVGSFFEKYFEIMTWWKKIDTNSRIPDIRATKDEIYYYFEIKSANNSNAILLKLNQLEKFSAYPNSYFVLTYYRCKSPMATYKEYWYKWFLEKIEFNAVFIIPAKILLEFEKSNLHLKRRQKLTYMNQPRDEIVIKVSKSRIEAFLKEKNLENISSWEYKYLTQDKAVFESFFY